MTIENLVQALILATGILGAILNANHNVKGFFVWIACNVLVMYTSFQHQQYGMTGLYLFYMGTCIWGIAKWKSVSKEKE